ncbi:DUF2125 domain-containing protein [Paracoccus sp. 1_MG-2023]|uniref:DUF2125 domain-containing protein n=1 Tax=unclassified Paracoccus (in: a-proteobacteria) TaxID=2688777 RepID=UPI001C08EAD3|nr:MULTISPECIES: DUF2125 domain-containing protein [unclassified Paracoccus (in: a-proteobacteria)]MBU2957220.1 DUF2125 domain-containing protein [Paracoccus sp. C2R09]MDO6669107.1 DUF2125 domain-containing protein [Paracoccus sp. 1_MG-2023]
MFRAVSTSTIALTLGATAAFADVTPAEVWDNMRSGYEDMGYAVEVGSRDAADDRLSLTDITVTSQQGENGSFRLQIPTLVMEQAGPDVRSTFGGPMDIAVRNTVEVPAEPNTDPADAPETDTPETEEIGFDATIEAPDNQMISSGSPEDVKHDISMPRVVIEGKPIDDQGQGSLQAVLTGLESSQRTRQLDNGGTEHEFDGSATELSLTMEARGPARQGGEDAPDESFDATLTIADLGFEGEGAQPDGATSFETDPAAALEAGFNLDALIRAGAIDLAFGGRASDDMGQPVATDGTMTATGGEMTVDMSNEGFGYGGFLEGAQYSMTSDELPFPIAYGTERSDFTVRLPVAAEETPQPFALKLGIAGLTLSDEIWQGIDPQNTLSREPADLTVDLDGEARVTRHLMSPATGSDPAQPPLVPTTLNIKQVALDAIGASVDIAGQLEFGDDPREPVGQLQGSFTGVNGLMDNLVAMGLLPQEQVMGARMMLAMFARPVEGEPDTLETQLKFTEGGSIFANGQQVK